MRIAFLILLTFEAIVLWGLAYDSKRADDVLSKGLAGELFWGIAAISAMINMIFALVWLWVAHR